MKEIIIMKAIIWAIIGRLLALFIILAFIFGIVYITSNPKFLWLLPLIFCVEYIPVPLKEF